MRHRPKLDSSHPGIVQALERAGATVQSLAALGGGVPDLVACRAGQVYWFECKPDSSPSRQKPRDSQTAWAEKMRVTVHIVSTPEEALAILGTAGGAGSKPAVS